LSAPAAPRASQARLLADVLAAQSSPVCLEDLSAVFEDAGEPVLLLSDDPEFTIVEANRAALDFTGYGREALCGESLRVLHGPETALDVQKRLHRAWERQEPIRVEGLHYRKEGRPYVGLVDLAPLRDEEGAVMYWIAVHASVAAQAESEDAGRDEVMHDPLTGLANRAVLQAELRRHLHASTSSLTALLYLDLNRFKLVSGSLGHSRADQLLIQVAHTLQDTIREADTAARIGGDEFAVCLPTLDAPEQAHTMAEQVYDRLNRPIQLDDSRVYTPASVGMVVGIEQYDSAENVLRDADVARFEARGDFPQPIALYENSITGKAAETLTLHAELRQGLDRNEFEPFFHPILALADGSLCGFEVLARWRHPERGLLPPAAFLDAAEETGLIVPIGHQVIREACQAASELQRRRSPDFRVALTANFSRQEFFQAETHTLLTRIFDEYDVRPEQFTMEVSERTMADVSEENATMFEALKQLGVDVVLDDFGTGFSSLQSLRRLPVDGLKIDKGLLADADGQSWNRRLIDLVVQIGHTLGHTVTAEGIERPEQLWALRRMGCSYGQGFLFERPVPVDRLGSLLDERPWAALWTDEPHNSP